MSSTPFSPHRSLSLRSRTAPPPGEPWRLPLNLHGASFHRRSRPGCAGYCFPVGLVEGPQHCPPIARSAQERAESSGLFLADVGFIPLCSVSLHAGRRGLSGHGSSAPQLTSMSRSWSLWSLQGSQHQAGGSLPTLQACPPRPNGPSRLPLPYPGTARQPRRWSLLVRQGLWRCRPSLHKMLGSCLGWIPALAASPPAWGASAPSRQ